MFAIMGITGKVGGAVAAALLAQGQEIRGVARNPAKAAALQRRGAQIARADYDDAAALEAAFAQTAGVFVMLPPNYSPTPGFVEARSTLAALQKALAATSPAKVVCLSSIGADQPKGVGLLEHAYLLEQAMGTLEIPAAFVRAGWFMDNSAWDVQGARDNGVFQTYLQPLDRKIPMVATADIARVVADLLQQSWSTNRTLEVAGPQSYSPQDIADTFSKILGRSIRVRAVPRQSWQHNFLGQGTPADRSAPRIEMLDAFNSGLAKFGVDGTEHIDATTDLETALRAILAR